MDSANNTSLPQDWRDRAPQITHALVPTRSRRPPSVTLSLRLTSRQSPFLFTQSLRGDRRRSVSLDLDTDCDYEHLGGDSTGSMIGAARSLGLRPFGCNASARLIDALSAFADQSGPGWGVFGRWGAE